MSIVKGLDNIRSKSQGSGGDRKYARYLKVKPGKSVKGRFLQELDSLAEGYDEERGLGFLAVEHQHPDDDKWYLRALCTYDDDGRCVGCEQNLKQKQRLYINFLVEEGDVDLEDDEQALPVVRVLSQGRGPQTVVESLLDIAGETGTVTAQKFKISRKGSGWNDTSYTIIPVGFVENDEDDDFEVYELDSIVRSVPYAEQAQFFGFGVSDEDDEESSGDSAIW